MERPESGNVDPLQPEPPLLSELENNSVVAKQRSRTSRFFGFRVGKIVGVPALIVGFILVAGIIFTRPLVDVAHAYAKWSKKGPERTLPEGLTKDEQWMYTLSDMRGSEAAKVVYRIRATDDKRYIPVLLELIRMNDSARTSNIFIGAGAHEHFRALEQLTGQHLKGSEEELGTLSDRWDRWYQTSEPIAPPEGFASWKGNFYRRHDAQFAQFFDNNSPTDIPLVDIRYGGVGVGSIPELYKPETISADKAVFLSPDEPVVGIEFNGVVRAYPQRVLDWHEMINDDLGGEPVAVSYCSLCGACVAYGARLDSGLRLSFGSSGLLHNSNKLMFDYQTKSLWNQLAGRAVVGEMFADKAELKQIPVTVTKWKNWLATHPKTDVVTLNTGYERQYVLGLPYGRYYGHSRTVVPVRFLDKRVKKKELVYGLQFGESSKAYPLNELARQPIVHDQIDGKQVVLLTPDGEIRVVNEFPSRRNNRMRRVNYAAGAEVRAYESGGKTFQQGDQPGTLVDAEGTSWRATELALVSSAGEELPRVAGIQSYWFSWNAFHPKTELFGE